MIHTAYYIYSLKCGKSARMRTVLVLLFFAQKCSGSTCRSSVECVSLRECDHYTAFLDTLEKPLKPSVVKFLRAQECGFAEGYPKVCCTTLPKGLKIFETATTAQPIRTTLFDITVSTPATMITTSAHEKKMRDFNAAFQDFLDFDLFAKRKRRRK